MAAMGSKEEWEEKEAEKRTGSVWEVHFYILHFCPFYFSFFFFFLFFFFLGGVG